MVKGKIISWFYVIIWNRNTTWESTVTKIYNCCGINVTTITRKTILSNFVIIHSLKPAIMRTNTACKFDNWSIHFHCQVFVVTMWIVTIGMNWTLLYGYYPYNKDGTIMTPVWLAELYYSTHQFVWSLTCAWVAYACLTGWGGMLCSDVFM